MNLTIRKAVTSDIFLLRTLSIDSFVRAYASFNTEEDMAHYLSENFSEEKIAQEISDPSLHFLLAFQNDVLAGYVKLNLHVVPKGGAGRPLEIARLYTRPEWIGQGIGREILRAVETYASENGYDAVCLDVWQKNFRAVNFYQREGFRICGLTKFTLGKDVQDDFVMIKNVGAMNEIVLETERMYLRKFSPQQDAAFMLELVNSPSWLKYIGDRKVRTEEQAAVYIEERVMKSYKENGYGGYVMVLKATGESIGNCGLFKRPALDHADIGYALLPQYEGKGYAYEASAAVMKLAHTLGMKKVLAITVAYNERSIHLLEKLGLGLEKKFYMEGDPEELSLYAITLDNE